MHDNSLLAFKAHAASYISAGDVVLEIGPDLEPSSYRRSIDPALSVDWRTAELSSQAGRWASVSACDYPMATEYEIPAPDDTFHVVLSGQVIEHVRKPWVWMKELARVAKPGGVVITISPVSWPYHEAPIDCWRVYPHGMLALCETAELTVEHLWWGTLEALRARATYPGAGRMSGDRSLKNRLRMFLRRTQGFVGFPNPVAYDLVTVARKRQ